MLDKFFIQMKYVWPIRFEFLLYFLVFCGIMVIIVFSGATIFIFCKHPIVLYLTSSSMPYCGIAASHCQLNMKPPCEICKNWIDKKWRQLEIFNRRSREGSQERPNPDFSLPLCEFLVGPTCFYTTLSETHSTRASIQRVVSGLKLD